ncbi:thioredoxin family protein [Candidatus Micrarchaeota archaeon]|nr:thioredoxin family protein [Candidatus Micrarchaeota archaeon]
MLGKIRGEAETFLKSDFNRFLALFVVTLALFAYVYGEYSSAVAGDATQQADAKVHFFYSPACPHCVLQKPFNEVLMGKYPNVLFVYHNLETAQELGEYGRFVSEYKIARTGTPTTIVGEEKDGSCIFVGWEAENTTGREIEECVLLRLQNKTVSGNATAPSTEINAPFLGKIDIKDYSLVSLAVVLGLIDGFNPCAMWVLVYLIAVVMSLNDRRKIWLVVGSFVAASAMLYFLFMTAWLNLFLVLGYVRMVTVIVGAVALAGGILNVKEYIETGGQAVCKVGDIAEKKKTAGLVEHIASSPLNIGTIVAIVALAFVVNSVEFVCSSAIPAVFTQVLAASSLSFVEHYGYILLYVFFFMLDDIVIFGMAAFAASRISTGEKYAAYCKVIGGVLLAAIGLMLLFFPSLLR